MIQLGKKQFLYVVKETDFGVYLGESITDTRNSILLPKRQVPMGIKKGDEIEVFVFGELIPI